MDNGFFAMISRMRYIDRWALMRNEHGENLSEHSFDVAVIAHALAALRNERFGGSVNGERAALLGLFHDAPETLTGDLPTPVKYYSDAVRDAYKTMEAQACESLLEMLPAALQAVYRPLLLPQPEDAELWTLVKAADKLSALIKCLEERKAGNGEFVKAAEGVRAIIERMDVPEAQVFLEEFLPAYELTLDELRG